MFKKNYFITFNISIGSLIVLSVLLFFYLKLLLKIFYYKIRKLSDIQIAK
jgi:hypothetical protein